MTLDSLRLRRAEILQLAARHGARNVRVFGSVARGDSREGSDVALLVELDQGYTLFDLGALLMDLRDLPGPRVDLVTPRILRHYIRDRVLSEATPL